MIYTLLQLLIIMFGLYALCLIPRYIKYNKSNYKNATGNSFIKTAFNTGNLGEFYTFYELEKLSENPLIMCNLYIPKSDKTTTEIDLVLIDSTGIYVFESKNYSGWIYGNESQKNWIQTLKNKQKNKFFNPIWQNNAHINALKNLLKIERNDIFKSYIVFSERCELKKIKITSGNVKVLKRDRLLKQLKAEIKNNDVIFSKNIMVQLYTHLRKYSLASDIVKSEHIQNLNNKHSINK